MQYCIEVELPNDDRDITKVQSAVNLELKKHNITPVTLYVTKKGCRVISDRPFLENIDIILQILRRKWFFAVR